MKKTKKELQVENFNLKYPVGTLVIVTMGDASTVETKTSSKAFILEGHSPVIFLENIRGCYSLERVSPK